MKVLSQIDIPWCTFPLWVIAPLYRSRGHSDCEARVCLLGDGAPPLSSIYTHQMLLLQMGGMLISHLNPVVLPLIYAHRPHWDPVQCTPPTRQHPDILVYFHSVSFFLTSFLVHLFSSPLCYMLSCSFQIMTSVLQIPNAVFTVVKCTHLTALHHLCVMQSFIFSLFPELASSSPSSPLRSLPSLYSIFL